LAWTRKNSSICCSSGGGGDRSSWLSQYLVYGSTPYGYTEDLRPYPARSCAQLATSLVSMMPGQPTRQSSRAKGSMVELFLFAHLKVGRHVPYVRWKKKTADQNSGQPMEFIRRNISEVLADLPEICAAHLPSDNSPILIKRGTRGYCQRWVTTASASTSTTASLTPRWRRCSQVRCSDSIVRGQIRLTTEARARHTDRRRSQTGHATLGGKAQILNIPIGSRAIGPIWRRPGQAVPATPT